MIKNGLKKACIGLVQSVIYMKYTFKSKEKLYTWVLHDRIL